MSILQIPPGTKTLELSSSVIWFDEAGILYSVYKPGKFVQQSREQAMEDLKKFKDFTGGKKVCIIVESHPQSESPAKEDREYYAQELAEITKAMAVLTPSAVSRMVANLFFLFQPPPYPTKMFVSVSEAKTWLQGCLKKGPGMPMFLS